MTSFDAALHEHLAALRARDVARFAATLAANDDLAVVAGDGTLTRGFDAVRTAHADWFASPDAWTFEASERWRHVSGAMGCVLFDVTYRQTPDAAAARFLLLLAFADDGDGWRFVYDQNTPIARPA